MRKIPQIGILIVILYGLIPAIAQDTNMYSIDDPVLITDSLEFAFRTSSNEIRFEPDSLGSFGIAGVSADAVLKQAEGLYIRNYGGHGGIKTISVRGFSAQQTTVSINGVPYRNPQSGVVNFNTFYPDGYQAISVKKSASSPDLNPLGANVDFRIRPKSRRLSVKAGTGSYGEKLADIGIDLKGKRSAVRIGYHYLEADDDYAFDLNGESGTRTYAFFRTQQYQLYMEQKVGKKWNFSSLATGFINQQQIPGPVLTGNTGAAEDSLDQDDLFYYLKAAYRPEFTAAKWKPTLAEWTFSYHYDQLQYLTSGRTEKYTNHDILGQMKLSHAFDHQLLITGIQLGYSKLNGNNLAINFSPVSEVSRWEGNAGLTHRIYFPMSYDRPRRFHAETNIRVNYFAAYGLLPNAGANFTYYPLKKIEKLEGFLHLHYGNRVPAFNELYYFGYGNANLEPEKVRSLDAGFLFRPAVGFPLSLKAGFFINQTLDKIISVPINPARYSTLSIGKTRSIGAEFTAEAKLNDWLSLNMGYTLQEAVDLTRAGHPLLPYTPKEIFNYGISGKWKGIGVYLAGNYNGWRFSVLQNDVGSFLPAYHLLEGGISYTYSYKSLNGRLSIGGENLLNANYTVIRSYPMPPASLSIRLLILY